MYLYMRLGPALVLGCAWLTPTALRPAVPRRGPGPCLRPAGQCTDLAGHYRWQTFRHHYKAFLIPFTKRRACHGNIFVPCVLQGSSGPSLGGTRSTPSSEQVPDSPWKETATEPLYNTEGRENPGEPGYGGLSGRASAVQTSQLLARPNRQVCPQFGLRARLVSGGLA